MKKQKQKKPEKSPEWVSKLSSALKKNLQRRKVAGNAKIESIQEEKI
jgi:hypothetical protein